MRYKKWFQKHTKALNGKVVVITGGNSGIGFAAARGFLYLGATVLLACRNEARARAAVAELQTAFPEGAVSFLLLDLASNASIDAFVKEIGGRYPKIDVFLHCAGVYYPREARTADGLVMTEGVNFCGTVRLAEAVLPLMEESGRMLFTTSLVDRFGKEHRDENGGEGYAAYARSKYLLSAFVLRRAKARGRGEPAFIAVHPGITATNLLSPEKTTHKPLFSRLGHAFLYLFTHTPEKAALTAIKAAMPQTENGACIAPRGLFGISGYPHATRFAPNVRRRAADTRPLPFLGENAEKNA